MFRVERHEAADAAVERVVSEQLLAARDLVSRLREGPVHSEQDSAALVHDIRKRCKEVRGICELVRPVVGYEAKAVSRMCRNAASELAPLRDAVVARRWLDELESQWGVDTSAVDPDRLLADLAPPQKARPDLGLVDLLLDTAKVFADDWELLPGFGGLRPGLERTYGQGRERLEIVVQGAPDTEVHRWRTSVKRLWYQVRLLEPIAPSVLTPMITQLDGVGEAVGDHHDLHVLRRWLLATRDRRLAAVAREARDVQRHLESVATAAGARLYAETPTAFGRRIATYWALWEDTVPDHRFS